MSAPGQKLVGDDFAPALDGLAVDEPDGQIGSLGILPRRPIQKCRKVETVTLGPIPAPVGLDIARSAVDIQGIAEVVERYLPVGGVFLPPSSSLLVWLCWWVHSAHRGNGGDAYSLFVLSASHAWFLQMDKINRAD